MTQCEQPQIIVTDPAFSASVWLRVAHCSHPGKVALLVAEIGEFSHICRSASVAGKSLCSPIPSCVCAHLPHAPSSQMAAFACVATRPSPLHQHQKFLILQVHLTETNCRLYRLAAVSSTVLALGRAPILSTLASYAYRISQFQRLQSLTRISDRVKQALIHRCLHNQSTRHSRHCYQPVRNHPDTFTSFLTSCLPVY